MAYCTSKITQHVSLTENEIDGEAFLLLSNEDVKDLVKAVGPHAKLMKKRSQLMKQTSRPPVETSTCIAQVSYTCNDNPTAYKSNVCPFGFIYMCLRLVGCTLLF